METTTEPPGPRPISDIELQRKRQEFEKIKAELDELMGRHHGRYRVAMAILLQTGQFSERELQQMFRGQVLSSEFGPHPCEGWGSGDLEDPETVEKRRISQARYEGSLDPVPVPRHRLRCPLHDRGRKGDPLVPCSYAQSANPNIHGHVRFGAPLLPPDLPEAQRRAINYFCCSWSEDMTPCKVLQALCQYDLTKELQAPQATFRVIVPLPPAPLSPPPEHSDDLQLRRFLGLRQTALEERQRLDAAEDQQRRDLLTFLVQCGRLTHSDLIDMTYNLVMVTDPGWLPCRDDPQRFQWDPPELDEDREEKEQEKEERKWSHEPDIPPQRHLCPLQVRGMLGDKTVPCCEAQRMVPVPEMIAKVRAYEAESERRAAEYKAQGYPMREPEPGPRYWAGEEDTPGGEKDLVRLLQVRPCYLLGRVAASYLYPYGQVLEEVLRDTAESWLADNEAELQKRAEKEAEKPQES